MSLYAMNDFMFQVFLVSIRLLILLICFYCNYSSYKTSLYYIDFILEKKFIIIYIIC